MYLCVSLCKLCVSLLVNTDIHIVYTEIHRDTHSLHEIHIVYTEIHIDTHSLHRDAHSLHRDTYRYT